MDQFLRAVPRVFQGVVSDAFETLQLLRSSEAASAAVLFVCQVLAETRAHLFVRERITTVNPRQAPVDLAQEPVVVVDQALDRLARQVLRVGPALLSNARELGLQFSGQDYFHTVSVQDGM